MAIKKPRTTKKRTHAAASGCGSSVSTVVEEMPPQPVQPAPPPLPPGVYFSPSREECLGFLNRRIAGDTELADARGYIYDANVYAESPEALRRRHPPASIRGRAEHAWWFLSETRFQSSAAGGGASKRADRRVESGGYWRLEQSKEELKNQSKKETKQSKKEEEEQEDEEMGEEEADGVKNSFGFYVGSERKHKTPWLMQEFTSANDDGAGKRGVHALYRVYVSPRASDKKLRDVFGEDAVKKGPDGKKRPARAMVPQQYFDGVADLLPEGSVRLRVQQAPPPQVATSEGLLEYHGHGQEGQCLVPYQQQQQQYLGQFQQQEGQDLGPYQQEQQQYLGQFQQQEGQDLGPYQQEQQQYLGQFQQQEGQDLGPYQQEQQQYLGQFQQQEGQDLGPYQQEQQQYLGQFEEQDLGQYQQEQQQYLGQFQQQDLGQFQQEQQQYLGQFEGEDLGPYQQQQGPFPPPEPRPATPDLSGGEFEADDNLSMPMDEFLQMVDEQPAEMIEEQPAETLEGEEPNWGSLGSIVEDDELADFNEEG